jgi:hypothetical protein
MLAQPEKAAAAKSSRKPSSLVSGSPYHVSTCYPASGGSVSPRRGWGLGGVEPMRESQSSGPSEPRVGLDCHLFVLSLIFLFHIFVVVFVSPPASTSIRSLYLSLSLLPLDVSYISLFSLCVSPRMSLQKSRDRCKANSTLRVLSALHLSLLFLQRHSRGDAQRR